MKPPVKRKLFCELSPLCYKISVLKCKAVRYLTDFFRSEKFAKEKSDELLICIYKHKSLVRRKLGNVDLALQENKAVNLAIASPKINGIIIKPNETFSLWKLVGYTSAKHGYKDGLMIKKGVVASGIGGGLCQMSNLLHWLILHSPLDITEHHHHDGIDMFPDFNRQVPFGVGTSISHNYLDYRFKNNTEQTFQIILYSNDEYLCGELRSNKSLQEKYHIKVEDEFFSKENDGYYRNNKVYQEIIDKNNGKLLRRKLIKQSHAKILYCEKYILKELIK